MRRASLASMEVVMSHEYLSGKRTFYEGAKGASIDRVLREAITTARDEGPLAVEFNHVRRSSWTRTPSWRTWSPATWPRLAAATTSSSHTRSVPISSDTGTSPSGDPGHPTWSRKPQQRAVWRLAGLATALAADGILIPVCLSILSICYGLRGKILMLH